MQDFGSETFDGGFFYLWQILRIGVLAGVVGDLVGLVDGR